MVEVSQKAPLEDLMAAMDVVDTLRHQQGIAERELDSDSRRERLLARLKDMYSAQGLDVPERILLEGIDALEQERFSYTPVAPSWRTKLARIWVSRARWGKPIGFLAAIGGVLWGIYFAVEVLPARQARAALPTEIANALNRIKQQAKNPEVVSNAEQIAGDAKLALKQGRFDDAKLGLSSLSATSERLSQVYSIRVISKLRESSGVWRIPPGDSKSRNYYLIVEAIDSNNKVVELMVLNEENNKSARKKVWGLRVNEETFYKIASDKQDDGIIQDNKVGVKRLGYLKPDFSVPTNGATITEW